MSEYHARWSLFQEGLQDLSWKAFRPERTNPILLHIAKVYSLAAAHDARNHLPHKPMRHQQSTLLTRWINLSDPNFSCDTHDAISLESGCSNLKAHSIFFYLLYVYLSARTEEPLLKAILKSMCHQELKNLHSLDALVPHKSTGSFWSECAQVFQHKTNTLAEIDATLRGQNSTPHASDLSALYPYFPPKWLFRGTFVLLAFGKPTETVGRYIRAIF